MIAALDQRGADLGVREFTTDPTGHDDILIWLESFGTIGRIGVEGTGTYGAGLCRFMQRHDIEVLEVTRGDRQERRSHAKSDPGDAVAAARAAQSGKATAQPKTRTGSVEAIRALRLVKGSATRGRTSAINQMRALVVTAPDDIRESFRGATIHQLVTRAARLRPSDPTTAATLLVTAGDNPERLRSEASFAHLCGSAPIDASSGLIKRKRLNPRGDRIANEALWRIVLVRMSSEPRTRAYVARRTLEGKSKREITRCLKRYVAREVFRDLNDLVQPLDKQ